MNYSDYREFYEVIAKQLKNKFSYEASDDQVFTLGRDAYDLRAGIRGIAREDESLMADFVQRTIESIHRVYNGKLNSAENYYEQLIINWWDKKKSTVDINAKRGKSYKHHVVSNYHNIRAKYIYDNNDIELFVPPIRLRDKFDYEPYITITLDGETVFSQELRTRGSGLVMTTLPVELSITKWAYDLHSLNFSVEITHRGELIYDSMQDLYRDFIVFKDGREIASDTALPGNYVICIENVENLISYPGEIRKASAYKYLAKTYDGDVLQSSSRMMMFSEESVKHDAWFVYKKKSGISFRVNGEDYAVVEGPVKLSIMDYAVISDFGVIHDGKTTSLHEFFFKLDNGVAYYNMSAITKIRQPEKIAIYRYSDNKVIASLNFITYNSVDFEYDSNLYFETDIPNITSSGTLKLNIDNFAKEIAFDINDDEIVVNLEKGDLIFNPPILKWKVGKDDWCNYEDRRGIWYEDLSNNGILYLNIPSGFEAMLFLTNNTILESQSDGKYEYKIGETVYSAIGGSSDLLGVWLRLNDKMCPLFSVALKPQFTSTPIRKIDEQHFLWNPANCFVGDKTGDFELSLMKGPASITKISAAFDAMEIDLSSQREGTYKFCVTHIGKGFLKKRTELGNYEICVGDESTADFMGKHMYVSQAMSSLTYHAREISPFYLKDLKRMEDVQGLKAYAGTLVNILQRSGAGGKAATSKLESRINPVKIIMRDDRTCIIEGTLKDASDGSCKYGLGIDKFGYLVPIPDGAMPMEYYIYEIKEI